MKNKQNLHTHTTFADGKDTPEELILEAIRRGFQGIGFSEHTYTPYSTYPNQMTEEKMPAYREQIAGLKEKYKGQIDIFCGLEYEFTSQVPAQGYDYLIGSVHYLQVADGMRTFDRGLEEAGLYIRNYFDGSGMAFAKAYFETVARLPEKGDFDIIGHFDLLAKHNEKGRFFDTRDKAYLELGYEAIAALRGKIPFFELNTGAVGRGHATTPFPNLAFIEEFRRQGFGVVITSDCHDKNQMDFYFREAEQLLLAAGYRSHWILTESGFEEAPLCK